MKIKIDWILLRYVYTAYTVSLIKYSNSMSQVDEWTTNVGYTSKTDNLTNVTIVNGLPVKMPTTYIFDRPVIANSIHFTLNSTTVQRNAYFELRGCDLEGKSNFYPNLHQYIICHLIFFQYVIGYNHFFTLVSAIDAHRGGWGGGEGGDKSVPSLQNFCKTC